MTPSTIQARDALPKGTRLKDYDIDDLLGVGGFGLVYRAREDALMRQVAIKEYWPSSLASRGEQGGVSLRSPEYEEPFALGMRSFINEARLLARFDHPALVRVIRFWEERGTAYMVMPCYEGPTLYEARRGLSAPPTEAWLRALMEPLLGALECLHREQVFHRDVAPDNILLVQDQDAPCGIRPVLLDFGAARRVISDHTQALTAILKPSFAPIEQYAETTVLRQGPWTDLYGLAAVLHYCITGRTPVPATARAVHDDLPSLVQMAAGLQRDFGREYSPALLATIDKALSVRPEHRPQSVAAWRDCLQAEPASLGPEGDVPRSAWNERTVLIQRPAVPTHAATQPLDAGLMSAWPKPLIWGLGALGLAAVVGLSAWTVQRHQAQQQGSSVALEGKALAPGDVRPAASPDMALTGAASGAGAGRARASSDPVMRTKATAAPTESADRGKDASPRATSKAATAAESGGADNKPVSSGPLNPRQACGRRVFIALAICMKRHCSRPAYAQHSECARMREQERANNLNRPYP